MVTAIVYFSFISILLFASLGASTVFLLILSILLTLVFMFVYIVRWVLKIHTRRGSLAEFGLGLLLVILLVPLLLPAILSKEVIALSTVVKVAGGVGGIVLAGLALFIKIKKDY